MYKIQINKQNILLGIIILLAVYNIFNINGIKTDVKGYKEKIELIQTKIDSSKVVDSKIATKIDSVKENVVSITKEIHKIDNTITIIKNNTNEKVNNIDKLSNVELEQFFTNRYNKNGVTK
jgi:septal ring factor EnvC (AmiA/AmiB activator)